MTTLEQRLAVPPSEMRRESPFAMVRAAGEGEAGDGLTLDGYAAVFNRETVIDSWEGRFREKIAPGAMKKSFRENPPRIQFDHGHHPLIGSIPIGVPSDGYPREEVDPALAPEGGAHIVARLHDNWLVQPVRDAMESGAVDGMSFRFGVVQERWFDADGKQIRDERVLRELLQRSWMEDVPDDELILRELRELRVPELGPVVWPAYGDTSVGVRSADGRRTIVIDLGRLSEPAERNKLAQAVLMADRAEAESRDEDSPPFTSPEAEEHEPESDDTPRSTEDEKPPAGEHESATKRQIHALLGQARHTLSDIAQEARTLT